MATVSYGTALAPIRTAIRSGKRISVITTETRPVLQGSRLNALELISEGIPTTLIVDSAVGLAMYKGMVDKVIVGADRITRDAVINKIGTYTIALAARENRVPFYVAAPRSTFDLDKTSSEVVIEERDPKEVTHIKNVRIAPKLVKVYNPAFDITPLGYVDGIITEDGILTPEDIAKLPGASS